MKRVLILTLALCLMSTGAWAEACYTVLPAEIDAEALKELTFGEQAREAAVEVRDDGQVFFDLTDTDGPPFCSYTPVAIQLRFHAYSGAWSNDPDTINSPSNVWPTGVAECAMTRDEAETQAAAVVNRLGLGEHALQSITAHGRLPGYRDHYIVAFLQRLNGRAVYWPSGIRPGDSDAQWHLRPQTNRVEVALDESGLIEIDGAWCRYEPTGEEITPMDEARAIAAFAASGIQTEAPEMCYFLQYDGESAIALPAWRHLNSFLHAGTGERLQ